MAYVWTDRQDSDASLSCPFRRATNVHSHGLFAPISFDFPQKFRVPTIGGANLSHFGSVGERSPLLAQPRPLRRWQHHDDDKLPGVFLPCLAPVKTVLCNFAPKQTHFERTEGSLTSLN